MVGTVAKDGEVPGAVDGSERLITGLAGPRPPSVKPSTHWTEAPLRSPIC